MIIRALVALPFVSMSVAVRVIEQHSRRLRTGFAIVSEAEGLEVS